MAIDHEPVSCVVADRFPRFEARFEPAENVFRALLYFRVEWAHWRFVAMKPEGQVFSGVLPKPKESLRQFTYYIEVNNTARTQEYTVDVLSSPAACEGKVVASVLASASVIVGLRAEPGLGPMQLSSEPHLSVCFTPPDGTAGLPIVPDGFSMVGVVGDLPESPPPTQPCPESREPVRVPRKLRHVAPIYPDLGVRAKIQGKVILECSVDARGHVTDVKVLQGIPLLDAAAVEAVKQWVYAPTLREGTPVPVVFTVTVRFALK
jgi:protein TonB